MHEARARMVKVLADCRCVRRGSREGRENPGISCVEPQHGRKYFITKDAEHVHKNRTSCCTHVDACLQLGTKLRDKHGLVAARPKQRKRAPSEAFQDMLRPAVS